MSSLIYNQYSLLLMRTAAFRFPLSNLLLKMTSSPRKSRSCLYSLLLFTFNSVYCDEHTFDCLQVEVGVLGGVAAVYHSSPNFVCWVSLIPLFSVFYRDARELFFFFFFVCVGMNWMVVLFPGDFFYGGHFAAIQPPHFFFVMFYLKVGGCWDELGGDLLDWLLSCFAIVPYYKLAYVAI